MSYTKRQLIEDAFAELALAGYVFDLSPEDLQTALRRMDSMVALWAAKNINISYPLSANPDDSYISQNANIQPYAVDAVICNLALSIAPSFGKQIPQDIRIRAKRGLDFLCSIAAIPPQVKMPSHLPIGAGNKSWRLTNNPFAPIPKDDPLVVGGNGNLDFLG